MLQERPNYLSVLSTENNIATSLLYNVAIKQYAVKKCREKSFKEVGQAVN